MSLSQFMRGAFEDITELSSGPVLQPARELSLVVFYQIQYHQARTHCASRVVGRAGDGRRCSACLAQQNEPHYVVRS